MNDLARHYSRFRVTERVLLTGHSHQAWPDAGFEAQQRAWLDAAALVDDKWDEAARQAWTNVCCVASSASPVSPRTLNAIEKTSRP